MRTLAVLAFLFIAQNVNAATDVSLTCVTADPCQHARGLGHCIVKFDISGGPFGGTVSYEPQPENIRSEVLLLPIETAVSITQKSSGISFQDETGDTWGAIAADGSGFSGKATFEQDFEFDVRCESK